jgi:hypothetical protein
MVHRVGAPSLDHLRRRELPSRRELLSALDLEIEPPTVLIAYHPLTLARPFDSGLGEEHAIELVEGGPGAPGGSLAAATDPRSEGLPAVW